MAEGRKNILRMFGTDIPGDAEIANGLRHIKGIGFTTSKAVIEEAGIDPSKPAGEISDDEKESLENIIESGDLPEHIVNRGKDPETGDSRMLVSTDLKMRERQDIEDMKKLGSYKGLRHRRGLPVRGQKTKSSFRGDSSVGVATAEIKAEKSGESEGE